MQLRGVMSLCASIHEFAMSSKLISIRLGVSIRRSIFVLANICLVKARLHLLKFLLHGF